ncbi:MAG: hypothetical protein HYX65_13105 [Gemmatimonadetes bacterium]|nr:hypothetical protein [Gemmatimonadota bacterium]
MGAVGCSSGTAPDRVLPVELLTTPGVLGPIPARVTTSAPRQVEVVVGFVANVPCRESAATASITPGTLVLVITTNVGDGACSQTVTPFRFAATVREVPAGSVRVLVRIRSVEAAGESVFDQAAGEQVLIVD